MVDFGSITAGMSGWLMSAGFWVVGIIVVMVAVGFVYFRYTKKGKLKYNVLEIVKFGNGKIGVNKLKAGLFGSKSWLFGLFDYGDKIMKTDDGRRILEGSTEDLHDIFGTRGMIVRRKDDDNKVLVPISRAEFKNESMLFEIAPADYRDTSVSILEAATKETAGTWEKILPYVAAGLIIFMTIISIVINQQMTNNTIDKVGKLLIQGCTNSQNTAGSSAP